MHYASFHRIYSISNNFLAIRTFFLTTFLIQQACINVISALNISPTVGMLISKLYKYSYVEHSKVDIKLKIKQS